MIKYEDWGAIKAFSGVCPSRYCDTDTRISTTRKAWVRGRALDLKAEHRPGPRICFGSSGKLLPVLGPLFSHMQREETIPAFWCVRMKGEVSFLEVQILSKVQVVNASKLVYRILVMREHSHDCLVPLSFDHLIHFMGLVKVSTLTQVCLVPSLYIRKNTFYFPLVLVRSSNYVKCSVQCQAHYRCSVHGCCRCHLL